MLGIFPSLNPDVFGGVEESARVAWRGIRRSNGLVAKSRLLCYGRSGIGAASAWAGESVCARTKAGAVFMGLTRRWPAKRILVWHLGLMRLLPFLRTGGAKVVLFLHGIEAWRRQSRLMCVLLKRVSLFLSNSAYTWDRFIACNEQFRDYPHHTVHLGVGTPLAPLASGDSTPDPTPAVLMVGRMAKGEDYKGHREMIAAWPQVLQQVPDAELWIVGSGDLRPEFERRVDSLDLTGRIRFLGRVSDEEKHQLIARCRCLALPSRGEGFGLVYLEAMRIGRPCLVSTLDAGREIVDPPAAGLAAHPDNRQELVDATCRLLTRGPEWNRWSERARHLYESQFTAVHFQQRLLNALMS